MSETQQIVYLPILIGGPLNGQAYIVPRSNGPLLRIPRPTEAPTIIRPGRRDYPVEVEYDEYIARNLGPEGGRPVIAYVHKHATPGTAAVNAWNFLTQRLEPQPG